MKLYIIGLAVCILGSSACKKENVAAKLTAETHQQLQGEWKIERIVKEVYEPIPTLSTREEYSGKPTDYYRFRSDHLVDITLPQPGQSTEERYEVVNPYQLFIGMDVWWIEELTATKLLLKKDHNHVDENRRYLTKIYLVR